ncbi:hypothetical protein EOD41_07635 [Mucilaginibacter limnophilus]|uniref:Uncharacterized protein n=1 Tax=Mucilaginibacter limnophilus TaxID=1932778 RepID=A0A437MVW9_9SPHI|nr:hypothetical protein [Mucilaginibacter limnophilus]RVU01819.1 hypothetical protein EOD41_07635 [Mucilaginibacter limnophilus]
MKKLIKYSNPFALMLVPVMFALIMGVAYQFKQEENIINGSAVKAKHATSLFYKGVSLFKTVAGINTEKVW